MLAEFYSHVQNPKESVKEFGESLLQIARKIMTAKPEFKVDIDNMLKAHFLWMVCGIITIKQWQGR